MRTLGILLAVAAVADSAPGKLYLTEFGRQVLVRTDQVIEARVVALQPPFRGITTAHLEVMERLEGYDRATRITLMYVDDLTAPDAFGASVSRSTVTFRRGREKGTKINRGSEQSNKKGARRAGVRLAKGEHGLFFLRRKGATYSLLNLIPAADPRYKAKRERLVAIFRIEGIVALDKRAKHAKEFFLGGLSDKQDWARGNSAREIAHLAKRFPTTFSSAETKRLATLLGHEQQPPIRFWLERALKVLDPEAALAYATKAERTERNLASDRLQRERERIDRLRVPELKAADVYSAGKTYGRAATGLVALYLADPSAVVRERAAKTLGEFGGPSGRVALRDALKKEQDKNAAGAMIFALGLRKDAEAVPIIVAWLDDVALEMGAIHALARIGTPAARKALRAHRAKRKDSVGELIDGILKRGK